MDNLQDLAQLRDIHSPEPIGWWPLATGWNVLALLVIIALITTLYLLRRYYLQSRPKRHALRLLDLFKKQYQRHANSQKSSARVSELLKRVAIIYYSRTKVASLQGEAWITFLNDTSKGLDFTLVRQELLEIPYQQAVAKHDLQLMFNLARHWISQRRARCLN